MSTLTITSVSAAPSPVELSDFTPILSNTQPKRSANNVAETARAAQPPPMRTSRAVLIILQMALVQFLGSFVNGVIVVGLPRIASDLHLAEKLYLWPTSVFGLTTGSTLLLCGAVTDVIGAKTVDILGVILVAAFMLGCGLVQTGVQLVVLRAFQGVGMAMLAPASVAIVTRSVESGKKRNLGFACFGLSITFGFAFGLVIGGILTDTIGWRAGFWIPAAILLVQAVVIWVLIPPDPPRHRVVHRLRTEIDWLGTAIGCTSLALFSYVLALISADASSIKSGSTIGILVTSLVLVPLFPVWMWWQEKHKRPALIPNKIWRNRNFTTICILTLLLWAEGNSMELFSSLYFQEVQLYSALQASLRVMPALLVGAVMNLATGYLIDSTPVYILTLSVLALSAAGPLIMALIPPGWSYWRGAFWAQIINPIAIDVLFTIGLIIVSNSFPESTQALAGAVYNTVAYFGISFGVNLLQVVSFVVTQDTKYSNKSNPAALLKGYRASFWGMFALTATCVLVAGFGLRSVGRIGTKRD